MDKTPQIGEKFQHPQTPIWAGKHPFSKWPSLASGSS